MASISNELSLVGACSENNVDAQNSSPKPWSNADEGGNGKQHTVGDLVRLAWRTNSNIRDDPAVPLYKLCLQRSLWTRLQRAFYTPGTDTDELSKLPADHPCET
eukprot:TRINITY_DN12764_c0_g1_i1.p1 TRINITY_DN12764_c0_g1~~TRINITY_DN12764_c0_g1_i1.p1  ORF type:complete len:104 (+),score=6.18 TRINITY_DN12764_c0_g1_i1:294-605(+)